jgi:hypothetical protein
MNIIYIMCKCECVCVCLCMCATAAVSTDTRTRLVFIAQRHMSKLNYHLDNPRAFKLYIIYTVYDCWVSTVKRRIVHIYIYIYIYYKRV